MKMITFSGGGMLTGVANMLEMLGFSAEDHEIALGMEAPYLLVHTEEAFKAGVGLYHPQWINLYLHPRGFHMNEQILQRDQVSAFLRANTPAMLKVTVDKGVTHPIIFAGYEDGRYNFINIKPAMSTEPNTFSFTAAMLKRRLVEEVMIYTIKRCEPQVVDFLPLLSASVENLVLYEQTLKALYCVPLTREEYIKLHEPVFRALMQDMRPMALLINDLTLAEELRLLNHDYRHVFTENSPQTMALSERIPDSSLQKCLRWFREDIVDRLYYLGASEEYIDAVMNTVQPKA